MRYSLRTLLITLTALGIGFGSGIAAEKWRQKNRQLALEREPALITTVLKKGGKVIRIETKLVPRDKE
jgi:hypothetical protein